MKFRALIALLLIGAMLLCGCQDTAGPKDEAELDNEEQVSTDYSPEKEPLIPDNAIASLENGITIDEVSIKVYKTEANANPISSNIYCADPTGVVHNGRLYIYGTSDQQQLEVKGHGNGSGYEHIKSLVIFSTDDMANWVYEGIINVGEIAPWIFNSWAPSIVSRVEEDGLTHFYLYFSNSGAGVGVLTSTDPVTGWTDPLGEPLIYQNMPGLTNCPAPFDPGVCIDDDGVGWLSFGGGNSGHIHSLVPKIARLGKDMISIDSEFVSIDAPYFNEASELNFIDGVYYYTYCNDWADHSVGWEEYEGFDIPPACAMAYMTTTTPLIADSWEYKGAYFYNAGQNAQGSSGMKWSNNHTHFLEFEGTNYIIHHTNLLEDLNGSPDGFRSMMVDYLPMDPETQSIPMTAASREGVKQIKSLDPYAVNPGSTMFTSAEVGFTKDVSPASVSESKGSFVFIKSADFEFGASAFMASVKGKGRIEVRLDDLTNEPCAYIEFDNDEYTNVISNSFAEFDGRMHHIYFVFSDENICLSDWSFIKAEESSRANEGVKEYIELGVNIEDYEEISLTEAVVTGSTPWNNGKDVAQKAVDGNVETFFDGIEQGWLEIDLLEETEFSVIGFAPRKGFIDRMVGGHFYGSNDGENWSEITSVRILPRVGMNYVKLRRTETYRYIRYSMPEGNNTMCNIAEIKLYSNK